MKMLVALLVLGVAVGTGAPANAKGCVKGARAVALRVTWPVTAL